MSKEDLIKTIETEVLKPDTYLFLSYINQLIVIYQLRRRKDRKIIHF